HAHERPGMRMYQAAGHDFRPQHAEPAAERSADEQRRREHAARAAEAERDRGRDDLADGDREQRVPGEAAENRVGDREMAVAGEQPARGDDDESHDRAGDDRPDEWRPGHAPAAVVGVEIESGVRGGHETARDTEHGIEQNFRRPRAHRRPRRKDRLAAQERSHGERTDDARNHDRAEGSDGERAQHLLEREERAGKWRIERTGDSRRGAAADEDLEMPRLEAETTAERRAEARAEHGDRSLAAG